MHCKECKLEEKQVREPKEKVSRQLADKVIQKHQTKKQKYVFYIFIFVGEAGTNM